MLCVQRPRGPGDEDPAPTVQLAPSTRIRNTPTAAPVQGRRAANAASAMALLTRLPRYMHRPHDRGQVLGVQRPGERGDDELAPALRLLAKVPFTAELAEALQLQLARCMLWMPLAPGCALFHEGDPGDNWYILVSGAAHSTKVLPRTHVDNSMCVPSGQGADNTRRCW